MVTTGQVSLGNHGLAFLQGLAQIRRKVLGALEPHGRAHKPRCEAHGPKPFRRLLLHGANDRRIDQAFVAAPGNAPAKKLKAVEESFDSGQVVGLKGKAKKARKA